MPTSNGSGKEFITQALESLGEIVSVLDIGAGAGNLRKRYWRKGQEWTGVEIFEPYVAKYKLQEKYSKVIVGDARLMDFGEDTYDLAFAGDVLEHMALPEAQALLAKLRRAAKTVIVSIPIGPYPQGPSEGNVHETHITDNWSVEDVLTKLGHTDEYRVTPPVGTFIYRQEAKTDAKPLRIAVYAISKNEEAFVDGFCSSAAGADLIIIGDTGSTDETVARARARGAVVYDISIKPWRFDLARNAVMALIPADVDVCISLDLDERLAPGWREEIERLWVRNVTTRLRYKFDWGHGIVYHYEKIHGKAGYHWHHPCHEYPRTDPRTNEVYAVSDMTLVTHHPDPTKSRGQYLDLLRVATIEDPHCPRNAFYYARELTFVGRWAEAATALDRYMQLPGLWGNELAYAMRLMGDTQVHLGDVGAAFKWFRKACAETPHAREPWFALAAICNRYMMWSEMFGATSNALAITHRELVYTTDPAVWGFQIHDYHALAAYHLGLHEVAVEHGKIAVELAPHETRLQDNLKFYMDALQDKSPGWLQDRATGFGEGD